VRLHENDANISAEQGERAKATHTDTVAAQRAVESQRPEALAPSVVMHLQRTAGNAGVSALISAQREEDSPVKKVVSSSGGAPLDTATKADMEGRFGQDFSDVRVHSGAEADVSAKAVDAHAYTVGSSVVFANGQYDPSSPAGQRTLAHELTHVVQQRSGPVDGTPTPGGIRVSNPSDRFEREAESNADRVMAQPPVQTLAVQREAAPEDEELQTLAVQREAAPEDEELQTLAVQRDETGGNAALEHRPWRGSDS
jgi:Domain of unknown function (DUF4157)